jgi:DNA-binding CsgD family transcriptional regulator
MRELAEEALRAGRVLEDASIVIDALMALGQVNLAEGDPTAALDVLAEAQSINERDGLDQAQVLPSLAVAQIRTGEIAASWLSIQEGLARAQELKISYLGLIALESAAEFLGASGASDRAVTCWSAIDSVISTTLNRTEGGDMGYFIASRARDREALSASAHAAAMAKGKAMTLEEALVSAAEWVLEADPRAARPRPGRQSRRLDLTSREREVLRLLAAGRSDGQIADELFISKKTAAVHVANIKAKLGAGSRVEIVTTALQHGLVEHPTKGQPAGR